MSKLVVVYTVAGMALFGALFAVFALAGIGRPAVSSAEVDVAEEATAVSEPQRSPLDFVPPSFEAGRTYQTTHEIPIYDKPDVVVARRETLPPGGYFTAVYTLTEVPGPWTEITVSDGLRDYNMFLLGADLRWKVVTPVYSADERNRQQSAVWREGIKRSFVERREREALEEALETEVQEAPTFAEWWADRADRMGGANVANLVVAGVASAVLTVVVLGAILLMTVLRREHEWSKPIGPRDDAADLYAEDDDPFTYAKAGSAYAEQDDEDPRRA